VWFGCRDEWKAHYAPNEVSFSGLNKYMFLAGVFSPRRQERQCLLKIIG